MRTGKFYKLFVIFASLVFVQACTTISDRAAKVQIQRQMSTLLDKCKNLGPITGEAIANEKAWSLDRGVQQAEANGRDKVAELGGDTFVVLNTDEYYGIAFSSKNKTVVQGVAMRCY